MKHQVGHPLTVAALDDFNDEPADRAVQRLRACNAAPRFAAEVVAGRPYRDVATLVRRAEDVARSLPWEDVAIALAAHPRIGDRVDGASAEAESSRREQSSMRTPTPRRGPRCSRGTAPTRSGSATCS